MPIAWIAGFGVGFTAAPLGFFIESRVHPAEWQAWKDHMTAATGLT